MDNMQDFNVSELSLIEFALNILSEYNQTDECIKLSDKVRKYITSGSVKSPDLFKGIDNVEWLVKSKPVNTNKAMIMEECSELIKAITKDIRENPKAREMVLEELVDVLISLQMCLCLYKINKKELNEEYHNKMLRNIARASSNKTDKDSVLKQLNKPIRNIKFDDLILDKKYSENLIIDFDNKIYDSEELIEKFDKFFEVNRGICIEYSNVNPVLVDTVFSIIFKRRGA